MLSQTIWPKHFFIGRIWNVHSIPELVDDIRNGKMVILVDDEDRENEGDLVFAAQHVTPEMINFLSKEARGLICLAISKENADRLGLKLMVPEDDNKTSNKTAFTISIEASDGIHTGISAFDRAKTISVAANPESTKADIISPGHMFPIIAKDGGVLERNGHTEASVDLAKLAGYNGAAVICEIMNDDGSMARVSDLEVFSSKHNIKLGSIADLIEYRKNN